MRNKIDDLIVLVVFCNGFYKHFLLYIISTVPSHCLRIRDSCSTTFHTSLQNMTSKYYVFLSSYILYISQKQWVYVVTYILYHQLLKAVTVIQHEVEVLWNELNWLPLSPTNTKRLYLFMTLPKKKGKGCKTVRWLKAKWLYVPAISLSQRHIARPRLTPNR